MWCLCTPVLTIATLENACNYHGVQTAKSVGLLWLQWLWIWLWIFQHSFSYRGVITISGFVIVRFFFLCDADLLGMVSSLTSALAAVSHGHSRLSIQVLLVAIDRTSVRTSVNRTTLSTTRNSKRTSITVSIWHSEDRASWYILIIKANEVHCFSALFGKELYMCQTD
jgi:hypothetical protein